MTNDYADRAAAKHAVANRLFAKANRLMDAGKDAAGVRVVHEARRVLAEAEELERLARQVAADRSGVDPAGDGYVDTRPDSF